LVCDWVVKDARFWEDLFAEREVFVAFNIEKTEKKGVLRLIMQRIIGIGVF
jgi:hypothetical protein